MVALGRDCARQARQAKAKRHEVWRVPQPKRRGTAWRHCRLGLANAAARGGLAVVETGENPATVEPLAMWGLTQILGPQMGETARRYCLLEGGWKSERHGQVQGKPNLMRTGGLGSPTRHHTREVVA